MLASSIEDLTCSLARDDREVVAVMDPTRLPTLCFHTPNVF